MIPARRILQALLEAALASSNGAPALDVSAAGTAAVLLEARDVPCHRAPRAGERYGVVVCEAAAFRRVQAFVEPEGSALVHVPVGDHAGLVPAGSDFELVASARTTGGAWVRLRRTVVPHTIPPRVSLVVVTRDDAPALAQLMCALEDEPTDPAWEMIIVDRGSFDATADVLDQIDGDIQHLRLSRTTSNAEAMLAGCRRTRGEVAFPIDLAMLPACGFVSALSAFLDTHGCSSDMPLRGTVYTHDGHPSAARSLLALPQAVVPDDAQSLAALLRGEAGPYVPGFRAYLRRHASSSTRLAAQELERAAEPQTYPVFAKSG
ncbi:MAG: glycosyltransferase [Myxococcota bacterium]